MGRKPKSQHEHEGHASHEEETLEGADIRHEMEQVQPVEPDPLPAPTPIKKSEVPAHYPAITPLTDLHGNTVELVPEVAAQILPWVGGSLISSVTVLPNGQVKVVKAANGQKRVF